MAQEINLVPEIAEEEIKKGVYRQKSNVAALVSLVIVVAIILGLFGAQLLLLFLEKRTDSDTQKARDAISAQKDKDITRRSLVEKLTKAQEFLALRSPYSVGFGSLIKLAADSNLILKETKFEESGIVTVTGEAASSAELAKLITSLDAASFTKNFAEAQLVSLTGSSGKPYTITLDFRFLKQKGAGGDQATNSKP